MRVLEQVLAADWPEVPLARAEDHRHDVHRHLVHQAERECLAADSPAATATTPSPASSLALSIALGTSSTKKYDASECHPSAGPGAHHDHVLTRQQQSPPSRW